MSLPTDANQLIVNKYCWMARKLRLFNDSSSIIHWCNAMSTLKMLLPQDLARYSTNSTNPINRSHSNHHKAYSVSQPTALSFPSATKPQCILTPSSTPPLHFPPKEPSPLTIHHPRRLSIHPVLTKNDMKIPLPKKRKTTPPSVDYHASTTSITSHTTSSQAVPRISTWLKPPPNSKLTDGNLPDGWLHCFDNTTRISYYWNELTGATQRWSPYTHIGDRQRKKPLNKT